MNRKISSERKACRPVYVIGHRCNDTGDIDLVIRKGCNALECDIHYNENEKDFYVNHDIAAGTNLKDWLNAAREVKNQYPRQFSLIVFDCKFAESNYIETDEVMFLLRKQVRDYLNKGRNPLNVIFSIALYEKRQCFGKISDSLRKNEGIAIDQSDEPDHISDFFNEININNCWYADGVPSFESKDKIFPHVMRACQLRDEAGRIKKVYAWTMAAEKTIRQFFAGACVDAIIVNVAGTIFPFSDNGLDNALKVIDESSTCRLALRNDEPFKVFKV